MGAKPWDNFGPTITTEIAQSVPKAHAKGENMRLYIILHIYLQCEIYY